MPLAVLAVCLAGAIVVEAVPWRGDSDTDGETVRRDGRHVLRHRSDGMRKAFQVFLGLFGTTTIGIALLHVVLGPSAIPGAIPVNATMDSEDRFYATLFGAYGVALLWSVGGIEGKSRLVYFLAAAFFVGGVARLVSMMAVGRPNSFFVAMTALELVIPVVMVFMQSRLSRSAGS